MVGLQAMADTIEICFAGSGVWSIVRMFWLWSIRSLRKVFVRQTRWSFGAAVQGVLRY